MDSLLNEAKTTSNLRTRARLYGLISDLSASLVGTVASAYPHFVVARRREVQGLPPEPLKLAQLVLAPVSLTS